MGIGQEGAVLSVPQLRYGGDNYSLDEAGLDQFLKKVSEILSSEDGAGLVEVEATNGATLVLTVSKEIPLAVKWFEGDEANPRRQAYVR
ncbi:hypothetical protein [Nocardia africana]|uniref:Uncharacterized protein n=1 Tax=Nocardia africana TaxID=134964 RepID=A0ABW6NU02_9NOCA